MQAMKSLVHSVVTSLAVYDKFFQSLIKCHILRIALMWHIGEFRLHFWHHLHIFASTTIAIVALAQF